LSFAIAGYFKLKIYIVSLNSMAMNEENLGTLFAELPKQCVVLLEDIDTAGLTHARDKPEEPPKLLIPMVPDTTTNTPMQNNNNSRISLSALLNIIDGVAATEGRILIMTTNHLDKLDDALIRPGRVDMTVKFDLANSQMIKTIFRGIFATLEGDVPKTKAPIPLIHSPKARTKKSSLELSKAEAARILDEEKEAERLEEKRVAEETRIQGLAENFADTVPGMKFSPAEIQGYLLKHKREPDTAIREAEEWVRVIEVERRRKKEREEKEKLEKEKLEREVREKAEKEKERKGDADPATPTVNVVKKEHE